MYGVRRVAVLLAVLLCAGCGGGRTHGAVLFTRGVAHPSIYAVPVDGGAALPYLLHAAERVVKRHGSPARPVTKQPQGWGDAAAPAWTPDSRTILFVRRDAKADGLGAVFTVPASGGGARELTKLDCVDSPTTADGKTVLYEAAAGDCARGEDGRIRAVSATGGPTRPPFAFPPWSYDPSWSPDGRTVAFTHITSPDSADRRHGLYVASGEAKPRRLLTRAGRISDPAWSSDGRMLLFASGSADGGSNIWMVDADGGGLRRLTAGPARDSAPAWLP